MPHDLNPNWMHVYDWLGLPPANEGERQAKVWLEEFVKPATERARKYLDARILTCEYEGKRYRVTGASRLGDVWLHEDHTRDHGYSLRVDVLKCSLWNLEGGD